MFEVLTRDSKLWHWLILIAGVLAAASRLPQFDVLIPVEMHEKAHASIDLFAFAVGSIAGKMAMSPLKMSPEGRVKAAEEKSETIDQATQASLVASAKMDEAVNANVDAALAAEKAKDISTKAAGQ